MNIKNWIYITGAPRSGTTIVGKILSFPITVDYIHEPFNPECGVPEIKQYFLYLRRGISNENYYKKIITKIKRYNFKLKTAYWEQDDYLRIIIKHMVGSRGPFYLRIAKLNIFRQHSIIKDPVGCFLGRYLCEEFGFKTVILIRHPVAFAVSVIRSNFNLKADLQSILNQTDLINDYLPKERELLNRSWNSKVEMAAILWRIINKVLLTQVMENQSLILVKHEDVSKNPLTTFNHLYRELGLPWSESIERKIEKITNSNNRIEAKKNRIQDFKRNSTQLLNHRLTQMDITQRKVIYDLTCDVAESLYPKESFII